MNGLTVSIIILAVVLGLFNFFLWASVLGKATENRRGILSRIIKVNGTQLPALKSIGDKRKKRKTDIEDKAKNSVVQSKRRKKLMDMIFNELILADIMMKPEEFSMVWLVATFVPSGLAALFNAGIMPAATLAVLGAALPMVAINVKKKKRVKTFEKQLSDALIMMCNSLRSGFSFQQSMETIARDMPAPIGMEFGRVCNEIKYGATLEDALENLTQRVKSPDLIIVVSAVCIQRTTGGNLSEILDTISETIRDRLRIKGEIGAITAQGRTSGMIIGALPVAIAAILMVVNPDYMQMFFTTKAGNIMIIVSVVMEIVGFFAIRKVVTIEY